MRQLVHLFSNAGQTVLDPFMGSGTTGVAAGRLVPDQALGLMQRDTVRYAKRQWTWFAREPRIEWIDVDSAGGIEGVAEAIALRLKRGGFIE